MGLDDIWDYICEGFSYIFSFEWFEDVVELFSSMFENLGEFSFIGLALGLLGAGMVFFLRAYMLTPFLQYMKPFEQIFWGGATYISCFIGGYLVGKHFDNTG